VGVLLLFISSRKILTWITKKSLADSLLLLGSLLLIFVPMIAFVNHYSPFQTKSEKMVSSTQKHTVQLSVYPYPGGDVCSTSGATGATASQVFHITHLVGDGKTDNYSAIQNAIRDAGNAGGGIVKLPAGTFLIDGHLVMSNNVTLEGTGPFTIIKAKCWLFYCLN
jgi:polygalacturonase